MTRLGTTACAGFGTVTVLLVALLVARAPTADGARGTVPATRTSVLLGVATGGAPDNPADIDRFATKIGRMPQLVTWFQSWAEPIFYSGQIPALRERGIMPMITWEPQTADRSRDAAHAPARIAAGDFDGYLRESAAKVRALRVPVAIRFAAEMNGTWFPWGRKASTPEEYIAAWRHVVDVFRAAGATNALWVWAPNVEGPGVSGFNRLYPGDAYVDWVGLDGYNFGPGNPSGWRSFRTVFSTSYSKLSRLTSKPMMIAETGTGERGGDKAKWIRRGLSVDLPRHFPRVRAVVWFDRLKERDWRVDSSAASLQAFRSAVRQPPFRAVAPPR